MAINFTELFDQRTETAGVRPSAMIPYRAIANAGESEAQVLSAAETQIPTTYNNLTRTSIAIEEPIDNNSWRLMVAYEPRESIYTFDTGGGFQHVTQSIRTRGRYAPAGQTAPNYQGAIGVTGSGVEGVDIQVPAYHFTETHFMADAQVTPAYKMALFATTGCVNDDWFRGFAPGELLFLGASGAKRGSEQWELTFRFSALPNQSNIQIGEITGITKYGWDYLWVQYEDDVDEDAVKLIKKPTAVYVEQVFPAALFSISLGIGA